MFAWHCWGRGSDHPGTDRGYYARRFHLYQWWHYARRKRKIAARASCGSLVGAVILRDRFFGTGGEQTAVAGFGFDKRTEGILHRNDRKALASRQHGITPGNDLRACHGHVIGGGHGQVAACGHGRAGVRYTQH